MANFLNSHSARFTEYGARLVQINAAHYLEVDADSIPTGKLLPMGNTPLDLRNPTRIGDRLKADFPPLQACGGFDQCFVIDTSRPPTAGLYFAARVVSPR